MPRQTATSRSHAFSRSWWSVVTIAALFGLLLWGRLRLRDEVPRTALAEPEERAPAQLHR